MLNQEVQRKKGQKIDPDNDEDNTTMPLLNVATHISDDYVADESLKIEIHKKINEIDSKETFCQIKNELEDRFGKISEDINIYMYEEWFEKQAAQMQIKKVHETKNYIEMIFPKNVIEKLDTEKLFLEAFKISNMFRFKSKESTISIILDTIKLEKHPIYYLTELLDYMINNLIKTID